MAGNAELDRLKAAQESAFKRKQAAYQAQQAAWEKLSSAKTEMNRAFEVKQRAYSVQESAWQEFSRIRSINSPRIDQLNSYQTNAYESMKNAFNNASAAHERREGASAKAYAEEGHRYKAECQGYVVERRYLISEIRAAKSRLDAAKPDFESAKNYFSNAKNRHDQLKKEYDRAQSEFKSAKADFDSAARAFRDMLDKVKSQNKNRRESDRKLAEQAGVPYQYLDDVKVKQDITGTVNFYFGGIGDDGLWHGHISMDRSGKVTYRRMPMEDHGSKNFTGANGKYNGQPAKIIMSDQGNSDRIDIYFGGSGEPDGPGHNHVVVIKQNIRYWRENGQIIINDLQGVQYQ